MEILGIGLPELIFIFVIALLILGPRDMQKAGKTVGLWLNKFIRSNLYLALKNSSAEIKNMSTNMMREANLELQKTDAQIRKEMSMDPRVSKFMVKTGGDRAVHKVDEQSKKSDKTAHTSAKPAPDKAASKVKKAETQAHKPRKSRTKPESEPKNNA